MNVLNDISYNCSNKNTLNALNKFSFKSQNHEMMWLMMQENGAGTKEFIEKTLTMYKKYGSNLFIKNIINMIVRKHIMFTPDIDNRQIDKLFSAITAPTSKHPLPSSKQPLLHMNQTAAEKQSMLLMKGKKKKTERRVGPSPTGHFCPKDYDLTVEARSCMSYCHADDVQLQIYYTQI